MNVGRIWIVAAALSGMMVVALGAFGAHGLRTLLTTQQMAWLQMGLQYQTLHTLTLLFLGLALIWRYNYYLQLSAWFLSIGMVLFSGSLYCLALSLLPLWPYITPLGGVCLLFGWLFMVIGAWSWMK